MKKVIRTIIAMALVIVSAFALVACGSSDNQDGEKGLILKKYRGEDFYTVYDYVDDGATKLDLTDAEVTGGVTIGRIASGAFDGNTSLVEIIVPTTVTEICEGAFKNMTKLNSLTLPFIGRYVKADAYMNQTGTDDDDVKAIDNARTISYIFGTEEYDGGINTTVSYNDASSEVCFLPATLNSIKIYPANDYEIPMYAFSGVKVLRHVELSSKVVGIGSNAFANCTNLDNLSIPASVKNIYSGAFKGCKKLNNIVFEANSTLSKIEDNVFSNTAFDKVNFLPSSIEEIGENAFANSTLKEILLPTSFKKIGYGAFQNCVELVKVTASSTNIQLGDYAFYNCEKLSTSSLDMSAFMANGNAFIGTKVI